MEKLYQLHISGRVQRVSYRANTRQQAQSLGLRGFVQNQPDGSVYAEIEGPTEQLDKMIEWCWQGPNLAKVESIEIQGGDLKHYTDFDIRR